MTIYRLVALGTIEETMVGLHQNKRALVDTVLGETSGVAKVSTNERLGLLGTSGRAATSGASHAAPES